MRSLSQTLSALCLVVTVSCAAFSQTSTWELLAPLPSGYAHALFVDSLDYIYVGTYHNGIFRSTDAGLSWTQVYFGPSETEFTNFATDRNGYLLATGGWGLYRTSNHGDSWSHVGSFMTPRCVAINSMGHLMVSAEMDWGVGVLALSTDNGLNWISRRIPGDPVIETILADSTGSVFVGTWQGVFHSTDEGVSWDSLTNGLGSNAVSTLSFDQAGNIFAGTVLSGIFRSTDRGLAWTQTGLPGADIWSIVNNQLGDMFAAVYSQGVYRSTDHGVTWLDFSTGLNDRHIVSLALDRNGFLHAASMDGISKTTFSTTGVALQPFTVPTALQLDQNYPNPFNMGTIIGFSLFNASHISIRVHDVLGNQVALLIDKYLPAGRYSVHWDAHNVASGVYYYRLQSGRSVVAKSMLLVR